MNPTNFITCICIFVALLSCKHEHPPASADLKQAYEIQKEGLAKIKQIESEMKDVADNRKTELQSKLGVLKNSMIEIEGMQHDHSQCSGDHSKKRFSIPDNEMVAVQSEWRDSIISVQQQLDKIKN